MASAAHNVGKAWTGIRELAGLFGWWPDRSRDSA